MGFTAGFPSLIFAPIVWGRAFGRDSRWRAAARWSTLATLIVLVAFLFTPLTEGASFLAAVVLLIVWAALTAWRALISATDARRK